MESGVLFLWIPRHSLTHLTRKTSWGGDQHWITSQFLSISKISRMFWETVTLPLDSNTTVFGGGKARLEFENDQVCISVFPSHSISLDLNYAWITCRCFYHCHAKFNLHGRRSWDYHAKPSLRAALAARWQFSWDACCIFTGPSQLHVPLSQNKSSSLSSATSQGKIRKSTLESLRSQSKERLELLLLFLNLCSSFHISLSLPRCWEMVKLGPASSKQSSLTAQNLLLGCAVYPTAVSASL